MPGPLPDPNARRRNKRKPNTPLPLDGPEGRAPNCPYALGKAGKKWWDFAWKLPQATAWNDGAIWFVARRAALEDDLAALDDGGDLSVVLGDLLGDAVGEEGDELQKTVNAIGETVGRLKALAGGRMAIVKEMREMDNRLGLNPKGFADLRWVLESPDDGEAQPAAGEKGKPERRLRAV